MMPQKLDGKNPEKTTYLRNLLTMSLLTTSQKMVLLRDCLSHLPGTNRIKTPKDIEKSKEIDWRDLAKAINEEINVSVTAKSIQNLVKSESVGVKNQTANYIAALLLKKNSLLATGETNFEAKLQETNYYLNKWVALQSEVRSDADQHEVGIHQPLIPTNKRVLFLVGVPMAFLIMKLLASGGGHIPNIVALYAISMLMWWFYRLIDPKMGFPASLIGTTIFLIVNTFAYFYSYHIMPNFQITIKPEFADMYYWGLTFTNVMLNTMTVFNFLGYAREWQRHQNVIP